MNGFGEPNMGNPSVRFDEGRERGGHWPRAFQSVRSCLLYENGAQISLVEIYSATRPTPHSECGHLPLKSLSRIAQAVRNATGLKAEVF